MRHGSNGAERDKWKASGDPKTRSGLGTVKSVGFRRIRMFVPDGWYWGRRGHEDHHLCSAAWAVGVNTADCRSHILSSATVHAIANSKI